MAERGFPGPFPTFAGEAGEWTARGDRLTHTRREVAMLADPKQVGNRHVMAALARILPGQAAPWHFHEDFEELVYVLEGEGELWSEGFPPRPIRPGTINVIAPGTWHTHRPVGEDPLLFLWAYVPPGVQLDR